MRRFWSLGAAGLVGMCVVGAAAPVGLAQQPAAKASSPGIDRFMKIRTPGSPTMAPDGTLYVRDWPDGIFQLYRVEGKEARPDAKMTALTSFHDGLAGYSMSNDGSKMLLLHATGGNENTQVSILDVKSGSTTELLSNAKVQHALNFWLRDDSGFVYTANDESPNDFYIYRFDFYSEKFPNPISNTGAGPDHRASKRLGQSTKLLGKAGSWSAEDISQDKARLLVAEFRSASDSSLYELDAKSGNLTDLTVKPSAAGETVSVEPVGYMPGDGAVLFTSDIENGLKKLFLKDLKTGAVTKPVSELEAFELDGAGMNREKTLLIAQTNEDGYGVLHVYRLPTFEKVELPAIEKGVVSVSSLRGNRLIYSQNNARTPGVAFAYDIPEKNGKSGAPTQVTFADTQGIDFSRFTLPQLVKYKSFDGVEIPAFVFFPANYGSKPHPIPFVVNYHGGPEGQSRPGFDKTIQYLTSQGFGVIQPNVRGSSGYGRSFLMMDDYKKRWDSVKDGVAAAQWLVDQGYSTPGKMATYGGSYGGFMSVACLVEDQNQVDSGARKERLFGAGVDVVGIVNMKTFLEQTSGYRRKLREVEYGPLTDPDFLETVSSIRKVDKINVPMFIAHGFNDPRVPVGEAMQLANALKEKAVREKHMENVPHLFIAPDEGHGFQKLNNRLYFAEYMANFLKQTIGKE